MPGQKILTQVAGGLVEVETVQTGGGPSANLVPSLNAAGQLDVTMMPTGIGADTSVIEADGALAAGDFVNLYNDGGIPKVRKADATALATVAHGFVLDAVANAANATVYWEGTNTAVTGQTPGKVFLSTSAGLASTTAPAASANIVQCIGIATSATTINFEPAQPIVLA